MMLRNIRSIVFKQAKNKETLSKKTCSNFHAIQFYCCYYSTLRKVGRCALSIKASFLCDNACHASFISCIFEASLQAKLGLEAFLRQKARVVFLCYAWSLVFEAHIICFITPNKYKYDKFCYNICNYLLIVGNSS